MVAEVVAGVEGGRGLLGVDLSSMGGRGGRDSRRSRDELEGEPGEVVVGSWKGEELQNWRGWAGGREKAWARRVVVEGRSAVVGIEPRSSSSEGLEPRTGPRSSTAIDMRKGRASRKLARSFFVLQTRSASERHDPRTRTTTGSNPIIQALPDRARTRSKTRQLTTALANTINTITAINNVTISRPIRTLLRHELQHATPVPPRRRREVDHRVVVGEVDAALGVERLERLVRRRRLMMVAVGVAVAVAVGEGVRRAGRRLIVAVGVRSRRRDWDWQERKRARSGMEHRHAHSHSLSHVGDWGPAGIGIETRDKETKTGVRSVGWVVKRGAGARRKKCARRAVGGARKAASRRARARDRARNRDRQARDRITTAGVVVGLQQKALLLRRVN